MIRELCNASISCIRILGGGYPDYEERTRVALILEIHSGPFAAYGTHFSTNSQLYASTSYGEAFAQKIDKAYPSQDYDDLLGIVDRAITIGATDPGKLFITGGSGDSVLTSWGIVKANRFRAAATQKSVINWTAQALTADNTGYFGLCWVGSRPWENLQKL